METMLKVDRPRRTLFASARWRLAASYALVVTSASAAILLAVWLFLLRRIPATMLVPSASAFFSALNPRNFGPLVFTSAASMLILVMLLVSLLAGWLLAGRMLAPLHQITAVSRLAAAGSLNRRINLHGRIDEFGELADAFDHMLDRLQRQLSDQRNFAASASHELRTPLATMKGLLDVAASDPFCNLQTVLTRLRDVNEMAIELTEALLLLGSAQQPTFLAERVDLSLSLEEAEELLLPLAERSNVALDIEAPCTFVQGSPTLLRHLMMNLLENAILYNLPDEGWAKARLRSEQGMAIMEVENSGDLINQRDLATFLKPFGRGDHQPRDKRRSAGLGLAIATSIAEAHGGSLYLTARTPGGLQVSVRLPLGPPV